MASKKKVRLYIPEEDLADLLGYWSKGKKIPVDLEVTSTTERSASGQVVIGPSGDPIDNMLELTKAWLVEEGVPHLSSNNTLEVTANDHPPIRVQFQGSKHAKILLKIDLDGGVLSWFRKLERDELESFTNDLAMVLSLKPFDFSIKRDSGIPSSIELTTTVYADGYSKDRLMSVLHDIRRSGDLVATIMKGKTGRSTLQRSVGGY